MAVRPGRLTLWGAAVRMFRARPLFGVGPDNYRLLYGRYSTLRVADPRVHSNNMYLEVLAGMGVVGSVALLWLGVSSARAAFRAARSSAIGLGVAAACAAIAVHGLVDSFLAFTGTYILFGLTLGLASACERDGRRHAYRV
jgi:O-antigen ligase